MKRIIISLREYNMGTEMIENNFRTKELLFATSSTIQFYYWEWTSHWASYLEHGQGD